MKKNWLPLPVFVLFLWVVANPAVHALRREPLPLTTPAPNRRSIIRRRKDVATVDYSKGLRGGGATVLPGWAAYNQALDNSPLTTKAITSLVGWAIADLFAQLFMSKRPFDSKRLIILAFFGLTYIGPSGHYFYNCLDSMMPGTNSLVVAIKIMVDQLIWTPILLTVFFAYVGVTKGESLAMVRQKLEKDLFVACQASWRAWPLVHAVNYKFIATKHRLIFVNSVQVMFNIFLSIIAFRQ